MSRSRSSSINSDTYSTSTITSLNYNRPGGKKHVDVPESYYIKYGQGERKMKRYNKNSNTDLWGTHIGASKEGSHRVTRKPVPGYHSNLEKKRNAGPRFVKKYQNQEDPRSPGSPGVLRTTAEQPRKYAVKQVDKTSESQSYERRPNIKILPERKGKTDPIAQQSSSYQQVTRPQSLQTGYSHQSTEDNTHFTRKPQRPVNPRFSGPSNVVPLEGGGYFPENKKSGLRSKIEKPKDHADVITYQHSRGISSNSTKSSREKERSHYAKHINKELQSTHSSNKRMYNYYRARRSHSSLALTEFLYDKQ
mmetsp:Transcript_10773/g.15773  ORF Transcript_10773/g.15773 Transcript_10773/m.15773 type:complete len:306 (-) Transcript_10773:1337-2254(-)